MFQLNSWSLVGLGHHHYKHTTRRQKHSHIQGSSPAASHLVLFLCRSELDRKGWRQGGHPLVLRVLSFGQSLFKNALPTVCKSPNGSSYCKQGRETHSDTFKMSWQLHGAFTPEPRSHSPYKWCENFD